jgi:hypothetical protein
MASVKHARMTGDATEANCVLLAQTNYEYILYIRPKHTTVVRCTMHTNLLLCCRAFEFLPHVNAHVNTSRLSRRKRKRNGSSYSAVPSERSVMDNVSCDRYITTHDDDDDEAERKRAVRYGTVVVSLPTDFVPTNPPARWIKHIVSLLYVWLQARTWTWNWLKRTTHQHQHVHGRSLYGKINRGVWLWQESFILHRLTDWLDLFGGTISWVKCHHSCHAHVKVAAKLACLYLSCCCLCCFIHDCHCHGDMGIYICN